MLIYLGISKLICQGQRCLIEGRNQCLAVEVQSDSGILNDGLYVKHDL